MSDVPQLIGRRATAALLVLAPLCEVLEALLSPLKGTSTRADLIAIDAHQGTFIASVVIGLVGTVLYLPAYLGLASRTASRSPRLAMAGGFVCGLGMLAFGGVRAVSALELQAVREPLTITTSARAVDGLGSSPVLALVLVLFLLGTAAGYPLLAASSWRAGLARPPAVLWGCLPFVAFFVDDQHWANVGTHLALLGSLAWLAGSLLRSELRARRLLEDRLLALVMVAAPALGLLELVLSPLATTSTRADVLAAAAHPAAFAISVLLGVVATVLYVPAFVGLASRCMPRSPSAARVGAAGVIVCMTGFMGVRAVQAFEPVAVHRGLSASTTARLVEDLSGNPAGVLLLVMFLGGSVVGLVALAVASWRNGLPRVPTVWIGVFPFVDLLAPGRVGSIVTHALLLVALVRLAYALPLVRRTTSRAEPTALVSR
jgi:hypothetical protein